MNIKNEKDEGNLDQKTKESKVFTAVIFRWFGVFTTAFTIFSNISSIVDFSNFIRLFTDSWRDYIAAIVNFILLPFNIELPISNAVLLFAIICCMFVALSSQGSGASSWSKLYRIIGLLTAALFNAIYFTFVALGPISIDPRMEDETSTKFIISLFISLLFAMPVYASSAPKKHKSMTMIGLIGFAMALVMGSLITTFEEANVSVLINSILMYGTLFFVSLISIWMYYVSDPVKISQRTFSILTVIFLLSMLNYLSLFFEVLKIE